MNSDLTHLSDQDVKKLIERYYSGENVKKLLAEYNINVSSSCLFKLFPPEEIKNDFCEYCKINLVQARLPKTFYDKKILNNKIYCPKCHHKPYTKDCYCSNCLEKIENKKKRQQELIKKCYSIPYKTVDFDNISFENKVYLGAICRVLLKENLYELYKFTQYYPKITPSEKFLKHIYKSLTKENILTVSPFSSIDAFVEDYEDFPHQYYIYEVEYCLNISFDNKNDQVFDVILNPDYYSEKLSKEAFVLWKKIAIEECIEYLLYQLKKVGFVFSPGDKTYKVFDSILNDFSVAQVYGIIWKSVAEASRLYLEKRISKSHAANSVIGSCERYADRAKINNWDLFAYKRIPDLPQSILSEFFFYKVLKIGDQGFYSVPRIL